MPQGISMRQPGGWISMAIVKEHVTGWMISLNGKNGGRDLLPTSV